GGGRRRAAPVPRGGGRGGGGADHAGRSGTAGPARVRRRTGPCRPGRAHRAAAGHHAPGHRVHDGGHRHGPHVPGRGRLPGRVHRLVRRRRVAGDGPTTVPVRGRRGDGRGA